MSKKRKIVSLQTLRAVAFIGIFLNHAGSNIQWAALGVSVFFTLSGFLMYYQYEDKELECSVKNNMSFSLNKIKKLYPLHIITMICAALLYIGVNIVHGWSLRQTLYLIATVGLNITLLQTWIPNSIINTSLNGVAWYLSVTMFLYFMFPYIKAYIKRKNKKSICIMCFGTLIVEILLCIPWLLYLGADSKIYIWFMYCFPVFRLGDFGIGCCFGKMYSSNNNQNVNFVKESIIEITVLLLTVFVIIWERLKFDSIWILAIQNWTTLYIPLSVIWIYLFIKCGGIITKMLTNKITIFIGNISAYAFLIHFVVTQYLSCIINYFNIDLTWWVNSGIIIFEFMLTIAITILYMKLIEIKKSVSSTLRA